MKHKYLTISLLLVLSTFSFGSHIDSLKQETVVIKLEQPKEDKKDTFDKYFDYFKDLLTPIIAVVSLWITFPLLRKKLTENHITKALDNIQLSNSEIKIYNQKLIDKYLPLTYSSDFLFKKDIEVVQEEINRGFYISQNGSSDVNTLMYFIKSTVQGTIRHYDPKKQGTLSTRSFLGFVISSLELVNFYSTQVLQIPKSTKTTNDNLINDKLRKFVTRANVKKYKHFDVGIINDPHSAHFTMFYVKVNKTSEPLLMRSAFQIFWTSTAIMKLMYVNKLYAPSELIWDDVPTLFGNSSLSLYLVGFKAQNQLVSGEVAPTKVIDLIYSNPQEGSHFVSPVSFTLEKICENFYDRLNVNKPFDISECTKITKCGVESVTLQFDRKYLEDSFASNKLKFKNSLNKKTVPNIV